MVKAGEEVGCGGDEGDRSLRRVVLVDVACACDGGTSAPGSVESVRGGRTSAAVRYGFVCHVEVQRFKGVGWFWICGESGGGVSKGGAQRVLSLVSCLRRGRRARDVK